MHRLGVDIGLITGRHRLGVDIGLITGSYMVRNASKSSHPVFAVKPAHFKHRNFPEKNPTKLSQLQPVYAQSNHPSFKTKVRTESKMVFSKEGKKSTSNIYPINQSTVE